MVNSGDFEMAIDCSSEQSSSGTAHLPVVNTKAAPRSLLDELVVGHVELGYVHPVEEVEPTLSNERGGNSTSPT